MLTGCGVPRVPEGTLQLLNAADALLSVGRDHLRGGFPDRLRALGWLDQQSPLSILTVTNFR